MKRKQTINDEDDFYKLLRIPRDADEETIKKAYRKRALELHPDRNPEDQKERCAEQFAKLTEAYEILCDVQKRDIYDRFGKQGLSQDQSQLDVGASFYTDTGLFGETFGNNFFQSVFGFNGVDVDDAQKFHNKREDVYIPIEVTLNELFTGTKKPYTVTRKVMCSNCRGTGAKSSEHVFFCKACKGTGIRVIRRSLPRGIVQQFSSRCSDCEGRGQFITERCSVCKGRQILTQKKTIQVVIHPGMKHGRKIVLKGEGDEWPGKVTADLIFIIQQLDHPTFTRHGDDLYIIKSVSLLEALTGFDMILETLEPNKRLHVTVDEVIQPGVAKAVLNEGMPIHTNGNGPTEPIKRGALVVLFEVIFPKHMNPEMKGYLKLLMDPKNRNKESIPTIESLKQQTEEWRKEAATKNASPQKSETTTEFEVKEVKFQPGNYSGVAYKQPYREPAAENVQSDATTRSNKRGPLSGICSQQ